MKKVLILSASPRIGGNSDILCDRFADGAKENGYSIEKIYINQKNISHCIACYYCKKNKCCFQNDDMEEILEKILNAHIIVLATPVYFYSMNGQLKTLIDRTLPKYTEIKNKDFYFIATAADSQKAMERTIDSMRGFTDYLSNCKVKGVIYGSGAYLPGEVKESKAYNEAYLLGKQSIR